MHLLWQTKKNNYNNKTKEKENKKRMQGDCKKIKTRESNRRKEKKSATWQKRKCEKKQKFRMRIQIKRR